TDGEAGVVEVDDLPQVAGGAVVKVGRAGGEAAEYGALELADVLPLAGEQRAAGVGCFAGLARGLVAEGIQRHVRRADAVVGQADVDRQGDGVVADVGRVMAGGAGAADRAHAEVVVQAADAGDVNADVVEQLGPAGDGRPAGVVGVGPGVVE